MTATRKPVIVLMGAAGSGKSTVGEALAARLDGQYIDADTLHSIENVAKMSAGRALNDEDRWIWLDAVGQALRVGAMAGVPTVVACSALRRVYRDRLAKAAPGVRFLHLEVPRDTLAERLSLRTGHYMPASLLTSQLATLEPLESGENGVILDGAADVESVVRAALVHSRQDLYG